MTDEDLGVFAAVLRTATPTTLMSLPAGHVAAMVLELAIKRGLQLDSDLMQALADRAEHAPRAGTLELPDGTRVPLGGPAIPAGMAEPDAPFEPRVLEFRLPFPTPLLNETLRKHWSKRMRDLRSMAWEVRVALKGQLPPAPIPRAKVEVLRHSVRAPDQDGMVGGLKALLDVLQPFAPPARETGKGGRPYGLGIIAGDDPARLELDARHVGCRKGEACTMVKISELAP